MKDMQKLIDVCFEIGLVISDPKHDFGKQTQEQRADWIAKQLRGCGFDTSPCGGSWGVLKKEKAPLKPVMERPKPMLVTEGATNPSKKGYQHA
jgi:hypothetical protein